MVVRNWLIYFRLWLQYFLELYIYFQFSYLEFLFLAMEVSRGLYIRFLRFVYSVFRSFGYDG